MLKKILISNIVTKRFAVEKKERANRIKNIKQKLRKEKEEINKNDKEN